MAKKFDPKAKAKKQKIILIVGVVLFVGILAVTLPGTLKQLNPPKTNTTPINPPVTATVAAGTLAPPTLAGSGPAAPGPTAVAAGALVSADAPAAPSPLKLVSFNLFVSKDPFVQQVDQVTAPGNGGSGTTPTGTSTVPTTPTPPTPPPGSGTTPPKAAPTSAVIATNGVSETVQVGKTFPSSAPQPYFQLVSLTQKSGQIGIAGGSLTTGNKTVTIPVGGTITLMNTADGTKYTIKLVSVN